MPITVSSASPPATREVSQLDSGDAPKQQRTGAAGTLRKSRVLQIDGDLDAGPDRACRIAPISP